MAELCEKLKEYKDSDYYPFHMPGHKRKGYMTEKISLHTPKVPDKDRILLIPVNMPHDTPIYGT